MCVCVWVLQMITRDWVWLITGLRGTEVCVYTRVFVLCVYRHASAGLSIHVNMSKTPEGAACAAQKKIRNWMKWLMYKKNFHSNQVKAFKLNTPVQKHTHTHTHYSRMIWHIRQCMIFFFCLACKKPPDGKMQKRGVSKKQKYDQLDFFFSFAFYIFFLSSAHLAVNETPSDLRSRSFAAYLQLFLSFSRAWYRHPSDLILWELNMHLQCLPMHRIRV